MANLLVWTDIPVMDLDRAMRFYGAVLDRGLTRESGGGFTFAFFEHEGPEVGGCLVPDPDNPPSRTGPLLYLNVDGRMAAAVAAVEPHGGHVLEPPHAIGPHGWRAVILDSEGNRVALHSNQA